MSNAFDSEIRRIERGLTERLAREAPAIRQGLEVLGARIVEIFVQASPSAELLHERTRRGMRPVGRP